jgi:hypothetical protein
MNYKILEIKPVFYYFKNYKTTFELVIDQICPVSIVEWYSRPDLCLYLYLYLYYIYIYVLPLYLLVQTVHISRH